MGLPKSSELSGSSEIRVPFHNSIFYFWKKPKKPILTCTIQFSTSGTEQRTDIDLWFPVFIVHQPNTKRVVETGFTKFVLGLTTRTNNEKSLPDTVRVHKIGTWAVSSSKLVPGRGAVGHYLFFHGRAWIECGRPSDGGGVADSPGRNTAAVASRLPVAPSLVTGNDDPPGGSVVGGLTIPISAAFSGYLG